jgi:hypothetical protein
MTNNDLARLAELLRIHQLSKMGGTFIPYPVK